MKRSISFIVFSFSLLLIIASCDAQKKSVTEPVKMKLGNQWVLSGFFDSKDSLVYEPSKSAELTISPDEKTFAGNTGCNAMRGAVAVGDDGKIKIGPIESMRKKCPNAETERKFLQALECVTNYKIEGALLKLYCEEKPVLQLESYRN